MFSGSFASRRLLDDSPRGVHAWACGDRDAAKALVRSALESMRDFDEYAMVGRMLVLLAWATGCAGDHGRAARLLGATGALWSKATSQRSARRWPRATDAARVRPQAPWGRGGPGQCRGPATGEEGEAGGTGTVVVREVVRCGRCGLV